MSAIGIIFSMAYLSACSNNDYAQVAEQQQNVEIPDKEELTEFSMDADAPEGTLKTYFFVSSEKLFREISRKTCLMSQSLWKGFEM